MLWAGHVVRVASAVITVAAGEDLQGAINRARPGDVIQEVNRQPVKSIDDLRTAVRKSSDKPALVLINRDGSDVFVTVRPANG